MIRSRLTILFLIASFVVLLISYLLPSGLETNLILAFNFMKIVMFFLYLIAVYLAFTERSGKTMKVAVPGGIWPFRIGGGFASARTWCFMLAVVDLALPIIIYITGLDAAAVPQLPQLIQQDIANILLVILSAIIAIVGGIVYEDEKVKRVI